MMMHLASAGPGWRTLKIERQLDFIAAPKICDELILATAREESHLLIDLDAVDAADELGVAALITAMCRVRAGHPRVRIAVLAHRTLLADSIARNLPAGIAEIYRDHGAAYAATTTRVAA